MIKAYKKEEPKIPTKEEFIQKEIKLLIEHEIIAKLDKEQEEKLFKIYNEIYEKIKEGEITIPYSWAIEPYLKQVQEAGIQINDIQLFKKYLEYFIMKAKAYKIKQENENQ